MAKRYVSIWFRSLKTDWLSLRHPAFRHSPFVLAVPDHGRMIITAANEWAQKQGIYCGMALADARAIVPGLQFLDDKPAPSGKLLRDIAKWCIRYSPVSAVDPPDGIILDASGCAHLWGGEKEYLTEICKRFSGLGYDVRAGMADTIGAAWAICRFGPPLSVIEPNRQKNELLLLPPAALRLDAAVLERLYKLGLRTVHSFIGMPRSALRRRFGHSMVLRMDQALGLENELIQPVEEPHTWQERLTCLDPIVTATGIEIALQRLLETLCNRLQQEEKGLRTATLHCYRIDGRIEQLDISTNRASANVRHLFKLFELNIPKMDPGPGIELFVMDAPCVEELSSRQEILWHLNNGVDEAVFAELLDRISSKIGALHIHRYLPDEHYWPERSIRRASHLHEKMSGEWINHTPRPIQLLSKPEAIRVTAPIPDYPPMHFRYKGKLHTVKKADGPERIEQEWWLQEGEHRDYYYVEDENGCRYWLFRSGHYTGDSRNQWFLHGFFA